MKAFVLILFLIGMFLIGQGFMIQNMVDTRPTPAPTTAPTPTTPTTPAPTSSPAPTDTPPPTAYIKDDISNLSPILPQ